MLTFRASVSPVLLTRIVQVAVSPDAYITWVGGSLLTERMG